MNARPIAAALALGLLTAGCVDNRASIQVQAICLPTDDCLFSDECEAQYIGYPTFDLGASPFGTMWLIVQVDNQRPNNADVATGRVNTADAHVDETVVEYDGPALPQAVVGSQFSVPAGGSAVVSIQPIPRLSPTNRASLNAYAQLGPAPVPVEMVARVRLRGYYDDGTRFETGEFPITIRVCDGCLGSLCGGFATCPPDSDGQLPLTCVAP